MTKKIALACIAAWVVLGGAVVACESQPPGCYEQGD
jgi:hypothetical protein